MFKSGSTIRDLVTGRLYVVIQAFKTGVLVASLETNEDLVDPKLILKRNYDNYANDDLVMIKENRRGIIEYTRTVI